jgi:hypothetical protein
MDQAADNDLHSAQGVYSFLPATANSAGFVVVPGSHREYVPPTSRTRADWCKLADDVGREEHVKALAARAVKLVLPAGAFIVFNSRTVHENTGARGTRPAPVMTRLATYVTFAPAAWATPDVRQKRRDAYFRGDGMSHWVDKAEVNPIGMQAMVHARLGFQKLSPRLVDGDIPPERAALIEDVFRRRRRKRDRARRRLWWSPMPSTRERSIPLRGRTRRVNQ